MLREKVEANERIRTAQIELGIGDGDRVPFLCECDDVRCRSLIRMTTAEYGEARATATRCVVLEGHAGGDGRVVKVGEGYILLED
jgi:hypothetical protein